MSAFGKEGFRPGAEPKRDLTKERMECCVPIAKKIIGILGKTEDLQIGEHTKEEMETYYRALFATEIEPVLREANINTNDILFIFQLITQPFENVKAIAQNSFAEAYNILTAYLWKLPDIDDVRVSDIIRVQKEITDAKKLSTGVESDTKGVV